MMTLRNATSTGRWFAWSLVLIAMLSVACMPEPENGAARHEAKPLASEGEAASPAALDVEAVNVARAEIPSGLEKPHYFKVLRVRLPEGAASSYAAVDGMVYQLSGVQHVRFDDRTATLQPGQGLYLYAGTPASFTAGAESPVEFLHFLLVPAPQVERTISPKSGDVAEVFRIPEPMVDIPPGAYDFQLDTLTLDSDTPPNPPHYRTGAAVYYVLSGTPTILIDGEATRAPAGTFVYEPRGLVHQWSNPGEQPATFVVAHISPKGSPTIKLGGSAQ